MSAYKKINCEIVNKSILLSALKSLELEAIEHETPVALKGWHGDVRQQKAEIIVPQKELNKIFTANSNDLGFTWNIEKKLYDVICSDYDVACKIPQRIKQAYAKIAIEQVLENKKFSITEITPNKELTNRKRTKVMIKASRLI